MQGTWKAIQRLLIITALLLPAMISQPVAAGDRSLNIALVEIRAEILPDGSMTVEEKRTIDFSGRYFGLEQELFHGGEISYSDLVVRENHDHYLLVDRFPTSEPGTYALYKDNKHLLVDWSYDAQDETRTFILEYRIFDVVVVHDDVAELYYKFVGDDWGEETAEVRVTLILPAGAKEGDILAWAHGPLHGEVNIDSSSRVSWFIAPLPANTFLEGRVVFPLELVPEATRFSSREGLPGILSAEDRYARRANLMRFIYEGQLLYAPLFLLLGAVAIFVIRTKAANRGAAYRGDYYRDLPGDYAPELAGYLFGGRKIPNRLLTARLLDMARRNLLRIEEAGSGSAGDYRLVRAAEPLEKDTLDDEVDEFLFEQVYGHFISASEEDPVPDSRPRVVLLSQIGTFADEEPRAFSVFMNRWRRITRSLAARQKFYREDKAFDFLQIFPFLVLAFIMAVISLYVVAVAIVLSLGLVYLWRPKHYYTAYGADQLARWRAFRRFLQHFSKMERSTLPSLAIWEHYLVYAVALNVAARVIRQLAAVLPGITKDPDFDQTHWLRTTSLDHTTITDLMEHFHRDLHQTIHSSERKAKRLAPGIQGMSLRPFGSSSSSSGSGSGGGFSSGGGGGFGGGGGTFR